MPVSVLVTRLGVLDAAMLAQVREVIADGCILTLSLNFRELGA